MSDPRRSATRPPLLRLGRRVVLGLKRRLRKWWTGTDPDTYYDLRDLQLINSLFGTWGIPPLQADPLQAESDVLGAARFILALLATNAPLRRRYPRALAEGTEGRFFGWLQTVGRKRYRWTNRALEHLATALSTDFGRLARRVMELRADLRPIFPLGLMPPQRGDFLRWLITHGAAELDIPPEGSLWYLTELDEQSDKGLIPTYLLNSKWQERFPLALTWFGWSAFRAWLAREYHLADHWLRTLEPPSYFSPADQLRLLFQAQPDLRESFPPSGWQAGGAPRIREWLAHYPGLPMPDAAWFQQLDQELTEGVPQRPGVNLFAHFRYTSGLQEAALSTLRGLQRNGFRTANRDIVVCFAPDGLDRRDFLGVELFDTTIVHVAANTFIDDHALNSGLHLRRGVHRIAYWYWELSRVPAEWADRLEPIHEIWAPTRFIADAMRATLPRPVYPLLPGVELPPIASRGKHYFGLDPERFLFLFAFDMNSVMERKNPLGLIEAFRRAFSPRDPVQLAIKVHRAHRHPAERRQLLEAAASAGVTVIDETFSRADALALMEAADGYVSLHRSEGLGLTMAESMLLGKPVIATAYSGNLDFMTPENSLLVDYRMVPLLRNHLSLPEGCEWADPNLDHAASLMRWVVDNPEQSRALGRRARESVARTLSPTRAAQRMIDRLQQIQAQRLSGPDR